MQSCSLTNKHCVPCEGGIPPLTEKQIAPMLQELDGWTLQNITSLKKTITFKNFNQVISFVNKVAELAEQEGHHPDLYIHSWNKLEITLSTHAINGLSENDFILAAKLDLLR